MLLEWKIQSIQRQETIDAVGWFLGKFRGCTKAVSRSLSNLNSQLSTSQR